MENINEIDVIKKRIKEIIAAGKISLYDLALDIGISQSSLYSILHDRHKITPEIMNKLNGYLRAYLTRDEKLEAYRIVKKLDEDDFCYEVSEIEYQRIQKYKQTLQEIKEIAESKVKPNLINRMNGTAKYGIDRIIELTEVEV